LDRAKFLGSDRERVGGRILKGALLSPSWAISGGGGETPEKGGFLRVGGIVPIDTIRRDVIEGTGQISLLES